MANVLKYFNLIGLILIILILNPLNSEAKNINILLPANNITLDPSGVIDQSSLWVNRQIHCQLFRQAGRVVVNDAAAFFKYETPTRLVVTLKSDLKFSTGETVTTEDVIYSIKNLKKQRKVLRNILNWVTSVESSGDNRIVFNLKTSVPQFQRFLTSAHYAILPKKFLIQAEQNKNLWEKPPGCGNYMIDSRDSNSIKLKSQKENRNEVVFWFRDSFSEKKADFFDIIPALSAVQSEPNNKFRTEKIFDPYQIFIALNTTTEKFKNAKNRCEFFSKLDTLKLKSELGSDFTDAKSIFPRGVLGFSDDSNWIQYYQTFKKADKIENLKLSFLNVSIPPIIQPIYEKWFKSQVGGLTTTSIENPKNFGIEFSKSKNEALVFGFKSNYLDGYEYLLILSEESANPTGFFDQKLKIKIKTSQDVNDNLQRAQMYLSISDEIKKQCILYPIVTMSYKKVFIKKELKTPNLGQATLNDYDLMDIK